MESGTTSQIYNNDGSESGDYSDMSDSEDYCDAIDVLSPSVAFFHPSSTLDESHKHAHFHPAAFSSSLSTDSPFFARSFACEKHSKWKKKCPANCPQRKGQIRPPHARRKLWTKEENRKLLQRVDPGLVTREDADTIWGDIARELHRSVNSTKKKYMRYVTDIVYLISEI